MDFIWFGLFSVFPAQGARFEDVVQYVREDWHLDQLRASLRLRLDELRTGYDIEIRGQD